MSRMKKSSDRGAALAEFGIIAPVLLVLLFGVIEFGLLFGRQLDVKHGAREAGRLAAVNFTETASSGNTQSLEIVAATCARMEVADGSTVTLALPGGVTVGETVQVQIRTPADPVTGFFDPILKNTILKSDVEVRLEQAATFAAVTNEPCP